MTTSSYEVLDRTLKQNERNDGANLLAFCKGEQSLSTEDFVAPVVTAPAITPRRDAERNPAVTIGVSTATRATPPLAQKNDDEKITPIIVCSWILV